MDEHAAGSMALGLVLMIMLALLAVSSLPRDGTGSLLFATAAVLATAVALVVATEGRRR